MTSSEITNEFSFILKPSEHGVGVFATHDIQKDSHLRVFGDEKLFVDRFRVMATTDVPEIFRGYCLERGDTLFCPLDFGNMPVGWYLNHSTTPNAVRGSNESPDQQYQWYAARDISAGEEILIDYNSLEEPEEAKADYYKS